MGKITALVCFACLSLSGCSADGYTVDSDSGSGHFKVFKVPVDGKDVTCIALQDQIVGGLDCDWGQ